MFTCVLADQDLSWIRAIPFGIVACPGRRLPVTLSCS